VCLHHRKMGTAQQGVLMARFRNGAKDHAVGNHPLWEVFRTIHQMTKRPFLIGGLMLVCGYIWAFICQVERPVSRELVKFYRREQMMRLKKIVFGGKALSSGSLRPRTERM